MLKIITAPNPILSAVAEPCEVGDKSLKKLSKQMASAMYNYGGIGIAGPQVGVSKRIIVVDCDVESNDRDPLTLINPVIVERSGDPEESSEGCLSCPGVSVPVTRVPWVKVRYYDVDGELWEIESDGLLGRCLQHEIDHLDGKTIFESCSAEDRLKALADYESAKKSGARPGDVGA